MTCRMLTLQHAGEWPEQSQWLRARHDPGKDVEDAVTRIIAAVREQKDDALIAYTRQFDCPDFDLPLRVSEQEIARAAFQVSVESREIIAEAAANIRAFHEAQREKSWFLTRPDGSILGQQVLPVDAAGLYVPGGKGGNTPLISSLLMTAIPAQMAGVRRLVVCTPPRRNGSINPHILAAAHLLDIDEVYRVGGAWAVAAMALGTPSLAAVDVIAGPGNIYVATAKRLLQGTVGIDMVAGPSEVLILADSSAQAAWLAADMLSQAEHDPLASAICVTDSRRLADDLQLEVQRQCPSLPRSEIASRALKDWGAIVLTPDLKTSIAVANMVAPEHLEICTRDPWDVLPFIRNAGAIFLGQYSPEPVGDYFAGPNHVLPTLGTARFSSALSVQTFCKKTSILGTSKAFLLQNRQSIAALARLEGLEAHARSVEARV
ncbi:MAG: histidinol dehydrogenase [Desulfovibrio sp.]|nr:histidinol dehydrogenase [Desulfovibrio sp.]